MSAIKCINQAPLPFQGQKRRFISEFRKTLQSFPPDAVYLDLFGGSGLLAHNVKYVHPEAAVIWNDFDNYSERLNHIEKTNRLLADFREILKDQPRKILIEPEFRDLVIDRIRQESGFVDYITLSSSLLFSAKYATNLEDLSKQNFYNGVKMTDYNADGYLQNVVIVREDYRSLFKRYEDQKNVVLLIDPPYLSTDVSSYSNMSYWRLGDYLDVLKILQRHSYFYFTSNKSQVLELAAWMANNGFARTPFAGATTQKMHATLNKDAKYTDIMLYKSF